MANTRQLAEPHRLFDFGDSERRYSRRPFLVFDVETNGGLGNVPEVRVVRLAWGLYDARGRERTFHDAIVAPDGFEISAEATRVHGVSTARARREGRPLAFLVVLVGAAACGENLESGRTCTTLCPLANETLRDTVFDPVAFDTSLSGFPLAGTTRPLLVATAPSPDSLDVRAVVAHGLLAFDWSVLDDEIHRIGLTSLAYGADVDGEDTARMMRAFYPGADSRLPGAHRHVLRRPMPARRGGVHDAADDVRACAALYFALRNRRRYRRIRARKEGAQAVSVRQRGAPQAGPNGPP